METVTVRGDDGSTPVTVPQMAALELVKGVSGSKVSLTLPDRRDAMRLSAARENEASLSWYDVNTASTETLSGQGIVEAAMKRATKTAVIMPMPLRTSSGGTSPMMRRAFSLRSSMLSVSDAIAF